MLKAISIISKTWGFIMGVIRSKQTVKDGQVVLDLPLQLSGQEVEIIVLTKSIVQGKKKSLRGVLEQYANPELISLESEAWSNAVEEKYGDL